jgi:Pyruvate/2-oxoacid:ferredoxin oxidoreductase delta subunit
MSLSPASTRLFKAFGMGLLVITTSVFFALTFVVELSFENYTADESGLYAPEQFAKRLHNLAPAPAYSMFYRVGEAMDAHNAAVTEAKGIGMADRSAFLEVIGAEAANYNGAIIETHFAERPELQQTVKDYTAWMENSGWSSYEAFRNTLNTKLDEVNQVVIAQQGFSAGIRENDRYALMRAGVPDWLKTGFWAFLIFGLAALAGFVHMYPDLQRKPGIHNTGIFHKKMQTRRWPAWIVMFILIGFYVILYQFAGFFAPQAALLDSLSRIMAGTASSQWFLYGFIYSFAMTIMGIRMMIKYRGNAYQQVRTGSVIFFQVAFAFTLPQILTLMQLPSMDIKSAWPLEYSFFFDYRVDEMMQAGSFGLFLFGWGIALFAIGVPVLTYIYGKRWYCSWVCGCGGLAETVGDPYRHLSDKRLGAWQIERWLVHGVLVFAVVMTGLVAYTTFSGNAEVLGINSYSVRSTYGFFIGFIFAGAVGTGFYPAMGNRVWCRFGCPLAAYLGLVQRFKSRFRITTNGGQCISCGNCSTYCEMGIDVQWYAQRGQNIVRSSCVGCGVCSAVCPRGVLKLENSGEQGRVNDEPIIIGASGAWLNM